MAQSTTSTQIFRTEHESLLYEVREEPAGHRSSWDPGMVEEKWLESRIPPQIPTVRCGLELG